MSLLNLIPLWVWPTVGGIVLGLAYSATFTWGLAKATNAVSNSSTVSPQDAITNSKFVPVAKIIAKQAYVTVSISVLRFILTAAVLVGLGQLTSTVNVTVVAQTGWACVGLVVGLLLFVTVAILRGSNVQSPLQ